MDCIKYYKEHAFKDLKGGLYRYDFFIPSMNCLIEVQGEQHYKPIYGRQAFLKGQGHDRQKISYCLANNLILYCIPFWEINGLKTIADLFQDKFIAKTRWKNDEDWEDHRRDMDDSRNM